MKSHVAGLHLWRVGLSHTSASLWITTHRRTEIGLVAKKASSVLRRNRDEYPKSIITGITHNGFIDA
jgi:hypothetical protein